MRNEAVGRLVVIGVGNELLGDEGVGVHVARELAARYPCLPVEIVEAGTAPDCWLDGGRVEKLVVVDAVMGGGEPGTIYRFSPDEIEFESRPATSIHQIGVAEGLKLREIAGFRPEETVIIGVEPKEVGWGLELSEELRGRIFDVVEAVLKEIISGPNRPDGG